MKHRDRLETALDSHVGRLLAPGQWCMETIAGHPWLYLPRRIEEEGDVTAGLTASLLVGAERLARESVERLEAYVGGVGEYLGWTADRMTVCGLRGDPQRLLDDPELQTVDDFDRALHARMATGPERFERPPEEVLAELPTGADSRPEGDDVDWDERDEGPRVGERHVANPTSSIFWNWCRRGPNSPR
jgi:hypothetical protein